VRPTDEPAADADAREDHRWVKAYGLVLGWLVVTVVALTLLSRVHW
jgi:hypothetical protein